MALELRQVQRLAQQLVMTPQLQQATKLLQLSRFELEDLISRELQENPALEETTTGEEEKRETSPEEEKVEEAPKPEATREMAATEKIGTLDWQEYMDTHSNAIHGSLTEGAAHEDGEGPPSWENTVTKKTSLEDHLEWQLHLSRCSEREAAIGLYIIGNLDDNGYLALSLEEVCQATECALEEVESVLKRIQFFDPVGVAATGDYGEVLPQQVLGQAGSCARRAPDQSRLHDRGFGVVAAAGVQCRMERLAADRSRWTVRFRPAERRWLDPRA